MSSLTNYADILNAISSRALEDGRTQLDWLDGLTSDHFGPEAAPASHSLSPAKAKDRTTSATFGPSSSTSSGPAGLMSSWESRLRQRLERIGSTECILTWKASATPAGRPLSRLVPSMRPIEEIDFGLWPTATSVNRDRSAETLEKCAEFRKRNANQNSVPLYLCEAVKVGATMWPTPRANEGTGDKVPPNRTGGMALKQAVKLWHTPLARDGYV